MPNPLLVAVEGLGRRHGSQWVLRGIEFDVQPGEVLAITGANGTGKSTLLKLVAGLLEPHEGAVILAQPDSVGLAALDMNLYPALTAAEHIEWAGRLSGASPNAGEVLDHVGLARAAGKTPPQLSTGMRARLKLAMAMLGQPKVLLLDEPSAALDEDGRRLVDAAIARQRGIGCAILATNDRADLEWATHELVLA